MDEADVANDMAEKWLEGRIAEYQHQLNHAVNDWPYGLGRCKNCGEDTGDSSPYCSEECCKDFSYRERIQKRQWRYR